MKSIAFLIPAILLVPMASAQATDFSDDFEDATMRIDYFHTANATCDEIAVDQITVSYTLFTSDNKRSEEIFTHELGHGFAGLADEYIAESYFDVYYTRGVEPLEPNITPYLNPNHIKWAHLLTPGVPLPTPAEEENNAMVGLFEGAGYTKTGMYRSCRHCVMGAGGLPFCMACQDAIKDVIEYYSHGSPMD